MRLIDRLCERNLGATNHCYRIHVGGTILKDGRPHRVTRLVDRAHVTLIYGVPCDREGLAESRWLTGAIVLTCGLSVYFAASVLLAGS